MLEFLHTLKDHVIQIKAASFLILKEANKLSVMFWPIKTLELIVPDGKFVFSAVLTSTNGWSTIALFSETKLIEYGEKKLNFVNWCHDGTYVEVWIG